MIQQKIKLKDKNINRKLKVRKGFCRRCKEIKLMQGSTGRICQDCNLINIRKHDWVRNCKASKSQNTNLEKLGANINAFFKER